MNSELLVLGYTILAGLLGCAFFVGRLSARVDHLAHTTMKLDESLSKIFTGLETLALQLAKHEGLSLGREIARQEREDGN